MPTALPSADLVSASGERVRLRLTWRQACTPSAGLASMVFLGALLGLLVHRMRGNGAPGLVAVAVVVVTVLWRRWCWSAEVGPSGLVVRRFLVGRRTTVGPARVVGRVSQLRLQVASGEGWRTLPAPRGCGLVGDAAFRSDLDRFTAAWNRLGYDVETLGLADLNERPRVLRTRTAQIWPWLVAGLASLVWQIAEPTMGGDLTLVAIALIVMLQLRQPRPVLRRGLWIGDGDRFVEWQQVESLSIESRRGCRRVVARGVDLHEPLVSPVDAWWAPERGFDRTYRELCDLWHAARSSGRIGTPSQLSR